MAATTPAAVLGLGHQIGALAPGMRADLVVLDDDLAVTAVIRAGKLVTEPSESQGSSESQRSAKPRGRSKPQRPSRRGT